MGFAPVSTLALHKQYQSKEYLKLSAHVQARLFNAIKVAGEVGGVAEELESVARSTPIVARAGAVEAVEFASTNDEKRRLISQSSFLITASARASVMESAPALAFL